MTRIDPVTATENELHGLFVAGLDGDGAAYHRFLQRLAALLRGYFRRRLQQLPDEVEDLVQETLMAVHTQRQTYRRGEPSPPGCTRWRATSWWTCGAAAPGTTP